MPKDGEKEARGAGGDLWGSDGDVQLYLTLMRMKHVQHVPRTAVLLTDVPGYKGS
jgi:hypothetical protein